MRPDDIRIFFAMWMRNRFYCLDQNHPLSRRGTKAFATEEEAKSKFVDIGGEQMSTIKDIIGGLEIFAKYSDEDDNVVCAEHDTIYASISLGDNLDQQDCNELNNLGWRWDGSVDAWRKFT